MATPALIANLEAKCMPHLLESQARLRTSYPALEFNVWSSPTGSLTPWQGHDLGIEVEVPVSDDSREPNWLVLEISTHHLTTEPKLQAFVSWGYSHALAVDASFETPQPLVDANVDLLEQSLPKLLASFEAAVRESVHPRPSA